MISNRQYSTASTIDDALAELDRCAGTQFDPVIVDAFQHVMAAAPPHSDDDPRLNPSGLSEFGPPSLSCNRENGDHVYVTSVRRPQRRSGLRWIVAGR